VLCRTTQILHLWLTSEGSHSRLGWAGWTRVVPRRLAPGYPRRRLASIYSDRRRHLLPPLGVAPRAGANRCDRWVTRFSSRSAPGRRVMGSGGRGVSNLSRDLRGIAALRLQTDHLAHRPHGALRRARPRHWLFPGREESKPIVEKITRGQRPAGQVGSWHLRWRKG
jgi:hypothetical protein